MKLKALERELHKISFAYSVHRMLNLVIGPVPFCWGFTSVYLVSKNDKNVLPCNLYMCIRKPKWALDNFSLIPRFFSEKVEIFIPLEVYTYAVSSCLILLETST